MSLNDYNQVRPTAFRSGGSDTKLPFITRVPLSGAGYLVDSTLVFSNGVALAILLLINTKDDNQTQDDQASDNT